MALTAKQVRFCEEYLIDFNATQAALRAGYSPKTAAKIGWENLQKPEIATHIEAAKAKLTEEAQITAKEVLQMMTDRARADVRELIELYRDCCRFCYGENHRYQETPAEHRARADLHAALQKATPLSEWKNLAQFDEFGGVGFDPRKEPHDDCPECHGRGVETVIPKDTRTMSRRAVAIYEGAKITANGLEIKSADRTAAVRDLGKYFVMWGDEKPDDPNVPNARGPQPMMVRGRKPTPRGDA